MVPDLSGSGGLSIYRNVLLERQVLFSQRSGPMHGWVCDFARAVSEIALYRRIQVSHSIALVIWPKLSKDDTGERKVNALQRAWSHGNCANVFLGTGPQLSFPHLDYNFQGQAFSAPGLSRRILSHSEPWIWYANLKKKDEDGLSLETVYPLSIC